MKMIKPIVNLSKIIDDFDAMVVGLYGTLFDGKSFDAEVKTSLIELCKSGKKIILFSNTSKRVVEVINLLRENGINQKCFYSIITAGEILHYQLKAKIGLYNEVGSKYYAIAKDAGVFEGLNYEQVYDISQADFLYVGQNFSFDTNVEYYKPDMNFAISLNLPLICAGNNSSNYKDGEIGIDSGAFAEQYATLGGKILTTGKPDIKMLEYVLDGLNLPKEKILFIGNNLQTDIKMANTYGLSSVLVSKGVHKIFLGEGYIPDVAKTREMAINFGAYPDYVISNFRF